MNELKKKIHSKESRKEMMEGINNLADVVGSTLGARGRNVILDRGFGSPLIINDGVTIAKEIHSDNPIKNVAMQLIKDAAIRTNALAGDGTTSSTVLARAIVRDGWDMVDKGANPVQLRKELAQAALKVEGVLKTIAQKIETKEQAISIATVSVQDLDLGRQVGELMFDIGKDGAVAIKNSIERGVFIEKEHGMRVEGALTGGVVANQDKRETKLEKARVLILKDSPSDHEFETKWIPLMKQFVSGKVGPNGQMAVDRVHVPTLVVIAEKISHRFAMAMNQNKEVVKWVWFRPTTAEKNMNEIYKDLQSMVGGQIVEEEEGVHLNKMTLDDLGKAATITVNRHEMVVTVDKEQLKGDRFLSRVSDVKGQIDNAEDEKEQEQIKERYANLTGGVATIKVAAATEQDTLELKLRIEDAINATRSAMEEGYVPGGGVALLDAAKILKDVDDGEKVLKKACSSLIGQILHNAGYDNIEKAIKKLGNGEGIDVLTEKVVDMIEYGIVDPLKVVRLSLIHAVSVAGLLLTSEFAVTQEHDEMEQIKNFFNAKA